MNEDRVRKNRSFRKKIVSWFMITALITGGVAMLLPFTSELAMGYSMPSGVDWDMDDLVTNSSGAVTDSGGGVYEVHEDIDITSTSSLKVQPGEQVLFDTACGFNVHGVLNAYGNQSVIAYFGSTAASPGPGDWDGISFFSGSSGLVDLVWIYYAGNGIYLEYTSLTISNSNMVNNENGVVAGFGAHVVLNDDYIYNSTSSGLDCYGSPSPTDNTSATVHDSHFYNNMFAGINCQDASVNIYNSYLGGNGDAIRGNFSTLQIYDSEIAGSVDNDFYLEWDFYATSLNTTFDKGAVYFHGNSTLEVQWYMDVLVQNASGPVPGADVIVSDNANGTWTQDYITNMNGMVYGVIATEYIETLGTHTYYTPHNVTASKGSEIGWAQPEPFMDQSKLVIVDLAPGVPPPVPPGSPENLSIGMIPVPACTDIILRWEASADDGAGANDVISYVIYRADTVDGTYIEVGNEPATGSPLYTWTDTGRGDGDWNNYFYYVRALDSEGLEDSNENKVGKFVNALVEGWNLFSVPLEQFDTSKDVVLHTLEDNYTSVRGYHAGKSRPWLTWDREKEKKNFKNDVIEIDHKNGYYLDMIVPDYLVTVGKVLPSVDIELKAGWNLVGYPSLTEDTVNSSLSSITGQYNKVEYFDTTIDKEVGLGPTDMMGPGLGYWIHATSDCTLTLTN